MLASYTGCSCCKAGDQGDSCLLLKELLKKVKVLFPLPLPISLLEELCAMTAVHRLTVCDTWHVLAGSHQPAAEQQCLLHLHGSEDGRFELAGGPTGLF